MLLESAKTLQALAAQLASSPDYLDRLLRSCLPLRSSHDRGYISTDLWSSVSLSTHVTRCHFICRPTASPSSSARSSSSLGRSSSAFLESLLFVLFWFAAVVGRFAGWSWTTTRLSEDQWRCRWWPSTATATSRRRGRNGGEEQVPGSASLQVGYRFSFSFSSENHFCFSFCFVLVLV